MTNKNLLEFYADLEEQIESLEKMREKLSKNLTNDKFTIVVYADEKIGFVNFKKEKINDEFYSIRLNLKTLEVSKGRNDVTDEDLEFVKNLIKE